MSEALPPTLREPTLTQKTRFLIELVRVLVGVSVCIDILVYRCLGVLVYRFINVAMYRLIGVCVYMCVGVLVYQFIINVVSMHYRYIYIYNWYIGISVLFGVLVYRCSGEK